MVKLASAILITAVVALLVLASVTTGAPAMAQVASVAPAITDASAQSRRRPARIIVRPRRDSSYPGPNAVRQCDFWLQPENRASGPVITPQQRCRWVRG